MDRIADCGISELLQPRADSNGFVNRRSVGSIPTTGSEFQKSDSPPERLGKRGSPADGADADRPFLVSLVGAGLRALVSDNDKADRMADRYLSRVDRSGGPDACWPWTGGTGADGYGAFAFGGRTIGAHRFACMLVHGEPPAADSQACHSPTLCKSKLCCNPIHLRWDSPAGNQADVAISGTRRGARNPKAKLTEAQVLAIWARRAESIQVVADDLDLKRSIVRHIFEGTNWAHLTGARKDSLSAQPDGGR